jgi:hypothetical protein
VKARYLLVALMFSALAVQGCSVGKATSGPKAKDLRVLEQGTPRDRVLLELGQPVVSENDESGHKVDLFKFVQGQHGAARAGKGLLYGALAVGTLGLSEVVTNPIEGTAGDGKEMQVKVVYDDTSRVDVVTVLKDDRWIRVREVGKPDAAGQAKPEATSSGS